MAAGSSGRTGVCVTSGMIGSGRRGPGGSWERGQAYGPFDPVPSTHAAAGPPRQTGGKAGTQTRHRQMARRRIHASRHPGQDRTRLSDAGFGGRCSPPEPECPPPGLLHGGSDPMAMNHQPCAWLRRLRGNIGQGRPNTGPGMASCRCGLTAPFTTHRQPSAAHPCCAAPGRATAQNVPMDFFLS